MSFDSLNARALILDVETVACDGAAAFLEPVDAPANYKDPIKIAEYIASASTKALDKCSLDPDLCRIVAIGWLLDGEPEPQIVIAETESQETTALEMFWDAAALPGGGVRRLASFYGLSFDLPVLIRRSQYLGVSYPLLNLDKYRTPHLDLHARLTFNGVTKTHSLEFYVKRFGLVVPSDDVDGSDIATLVAAGEWEKVRRHCEIDVLKTAALARRLGFLAAAVESVEGIAV
jgi:predicted PolB exonuclease-like 3'-5' exonuclease